MVMSNEKIYLMCDGKLFKALVAAGLSWLESHYQRVNELNVFPVPDGDTGTNMLLTMRNANREISNLDTQHVAKIADKLAYGATMGSRGNSGTILSQLWRGVAYGLADHESFDVPLLSKALRAGVDTAYRAVQRPVEGTILTVAREIAEESELHAHKVTDLTEIFDCIVKRGWDAVKRTPDLLPVLKEAGVVDSGGTGLMYIFEGMLRYLRDEPVKVENSVYTEIEHETRYEGGGQLQHPGENIYDVQFVIRGKSLRADVIKSAMEAMGDSVVVSPAEDVVKVHVHVSNPGHPLEYAANVGPIVDIVVENMLEQYEEFLRQRQQNTSSSELALAEVGAGQIAVIAVTPGAGLASVFQELGVAGLVSGGQTNNPSVEEFLTTIKKLNTDKIILLPNNKNIILTAQQAAELAEDVSVFVIPTRTIPQGISAMLSYNPDGELGAVAEAMTEAKNNIITAEVTTATRSVELDGVKVENGQIIGLLDGKLSIAGDMVEAVVVDLLAEIDLGDMELVTLYYGNHIAETDAYALSERLAEIYPDLAFEVFMGGQPHYHYILSVE